VVGAQRLHGLSAIGAALAMYAIPIAAQIIPLAAPEVGRTRTGARFRQESSKKLPSRPPESLPYPAATAGAREELAIAELPKSSGISLEKEPIMNQGWSDQHPIKQQGHPGYVAPPGNPFGQAKGMAAKAWVAAGLLFGGFVFAAIALFLPWATVSVDSPLGGSLYQVDASPFKGGWVFAILLVIAGAAWLAWPTVSGSQLSIKRVTGLTAVVGLQILFLFIGLANYANGVSEKNKGMGGIGDDLSGVHVSVGFGMVLYAAAVVAIAAGLIRVWIHRSKKGIRAS
jgi:hypothetical protein